MDNKYFDIEVKFNNRPATKWRRMCQAEFSSIMNEDNPELLEGLDELSEDDQFDVCFDLLRQQAEWVTIIKEGEPGWDYL